VGGKNIRIGRIAGIPVGISPWWIAVVVLLTWDLGASYYPNVVPGISHGASYALAFVSVICFFASILAHEFGHAIVARKHGVVVDEIDLWLLGGVSKMEGEAHDAGGELRYAIAGPAVTAVIAAVFLAATLALPSSAPAALHAFLEYQVFFNVVVLIFNMLPAFPLDGGRVLRSILWKRSGNITRATQTAARVGRAFGFVMIGLGVIELLEFGVGGIWLILVGFFITTAARAELAGLQMRTTFAESVAGDLMSAPAVTILGAMPADEAAQFFTRYRFTSFPVVDVDDRVVGLLDIAHLRAAGALDGLRADGLADSDPELLAAASDPVVGLLERPAFSRVGRLVVVDADRKALGLLSITDAQRAVRAAEVAEPVRA